MKADIITWTQLANSRHPEGAVVLLDGGLVTVRSISEDINSLMGSRRRYRLNYTAPWGDLLTTTVRGDFRTALIDSDPQDQEGN